LLAHGRWFSSGTPASSTTKTGRHDIAEILLKVALDTKNHNRLMHIAATIKHFASNTQSYIDTGDITSCFRKICFYVISNKHEDITPTMNGKDGVRQ
jgi:hypothetical protein